MPRWTDRGPYRLDLDGMLDQVREAIVARPELRSHLEVLQEPPDLADVIAAQRNLILAGVPGLESRANATAFRLRDLLFASLVSDLAEAEEADFITSSIGWFEVTIGALETWNPASSDRLPPEGLIPRAEVLQQIAQTYSMIVMSWQQRYGPAAWQFGAVPGIFGMGMPMPAAGSVVEITDDPVGRIAAVRQELELCRAAASDLSSMLEQKLIGQVTAAREKHGYRALETEWESQLRELQTALEKAVLAVALTAMNEAVVAATAPRMRAASLDGLRSAVDDDKVVATEAFSQMTSKLQQRSEGSFGIAGPRGVGKTTLMKYLAVGPGLGPRDGAQGSGAAAGKPCLGVLVSAPVRYQAREFVLYLYAELCKALAGPDPEQALLDKIRQLDQETKPPVRFAWQAWLAAVAILGAGAVAGGAALLGWTIRHAVGAPVHVVAWVGAGVLASAAAVLLVVLWRPLGEAFRISVEVVGLGSVEIEPPLPRAEGSGGKSSSVTSLLPRRAVWYFQYAAVAVVGGITLLLAGGGWPGGSGLLVSGITLLAAGIAGLRCSRLAGRMPLPGLFELRAGSPPLSYQEEGKPRGAKLREQAIETLLQIRIQQSFSSERTRTATVTGPSVFPAGFEFDAKRGVTWEQREKTYPELVAANTW
jgi:soluble cytochrome b562